MATTARRDEIEIALPAELVPPILSALNELRGAASGERAALWEGLARRLLREVAASAEAASAEGTLVAPRAALRELLAVAIEDVADGIARAASGLLRGDDAQAAELRASHEELGALLGLLEPVLGA